MDWFLYDNGLGHESVKGELQMCYISLTTQQHVSCAILDWVTVAGINK